MLLNGKTDGESKKIVDDFIGRYTAALAEEKSFLMRFHHNWIFQDLKTKQLGLMKI